MPECPDGYGCATNAPSPIAGVTVTRADGTLTASWQLVGTATSYHITYTSNGGQSLGPSPHFDHTENSITIAATNSETYIVGRARTQLFRRKQLGKLLACRTFHARSRTYSDTNANPYSYASPSNAARPPWHRSRSRETMGPLTASWNAAGNATSYHITYTSNGGQSWSPRRL